MSDHNLGKYFKMYKSQDFNSFIIFIKSCFVGTYIFGTIFS